MTLMEAMVSGALGDQVLVATRDHAALLRGAALTRQEAMLAPNSPDPYERELGWHVMRRDKDELEKLRDRLQGVPALDTSTREDVRGRYERGEHDDILAKETDTALARLDRALAEAEKSGHKPTIAAVHLLRGNRLRERAEMRRDPAAAAQAVAALRAADRAWPGIGAEAKVAWALLVVAAIQASAASPAVAERWGAEFRRYGMALWLHHLAAASASEPLMALRKEPALREAAMLRKAKLKERPTVEDWCLAEALDDRDMLASAAGAFARDEYRLETEIWARLYPTSPGVQERLALFAQRR